MPNRMLCSGETRSNAVSILPTRQLGNCSTQISQRLVSREAGEVPEQLSRRIPLVRSFADNFHRTGLLSMGDLRLTLDGNGF